MKGRDHMGGLSVGGGGGEIKVNLDETEFEIVDWIHQVQDRAQWLALVNTVMNLRV
jgi:hypothetical protein